MFCVSTPLTPHQLAAYPTPFRESEVLHSRLQAASNVEVMERGKTSNSNSTSGKISAYPPKKGE
jgi:hypothetical protein